MIPARDAQTERQRLVRLLHVAKRELRMVDADYRAILLRVSGGARDSSREMPVVELEKALSHMKVCGFKVRTKAKSGATKPKTSRPLATDPEARKIRALWLLLHSLGGVANPSEAALAAYVKRITRVDDLHWITSAQAETLIEAMKKWALRFLPGEVRRLLEEVRNLHLADEQVGQLNRTLSLAFDRGTFGPMNEAWQLLNELQGKTAK